jgi:hypothetical protein
MADAEVLLAGNPSINDKPGIRLTLSQFSINILLTYHNAKTGQSTVQNAPVRAVGMLPELLVSLVLLS